MLHKKNQQRQVERVHGKATCLLIILSQFPLKSTYHTKDQTPHWMHDLIEKVVDVPVDGNCGFRVVAGLRDSILFLRMTKF